LDNHKATGPERTCIVTRTLQPAKNMLRFVLGPGDQVFPDLRGRLPGRGVYVSLSVQALRLAIKKNAFARAFKVKAEVSPGLDGEVDALLRKAALSALSLANKAGGIIAGFAKVEAALGGNSVIALVHALEGSGHGTQKLAQALHRREENRRQVSEFRLFASAELDSALGRDNVVHLAVLNGDAGRFLLQSLQRYSTYSGAQEVTGDIVAEENFCNPDEICDKSDEISEE